MSRWGGSAFTVITANAFPPITTNTILPYDNTMQLYGAWGTSSTDLWVVGDTDTLNGTLAFNPVIGHFDGAAWSTQALPGGLTSELTSIWGTSDSDIWAGGEAQNDAGAYTAGAAVHWNGATWSAASVGGLPPFGVIWGGASSDVWAVGYDGAAWTAAPIPGLATGLTQEVTFISGTGPDDVWFSAPNAGFSGSGELVHYGGRADCTLSDTTCWSKCGPPATSNYLVSALWANAPDDLWVIEARSGGDGVWQSGGVSPDLLFHWAGGTCDASATFTAVEYRGWPAAFTQSANANRNPFLGFGPKDMWMVGVSGSIVHRANDAGP